MATPHLDPHLVAQFSLAGRTAVVTGAASGIGAQAALTFAQAGADVVVADTNVDGLEATAERVRALGRRATVVPTNVGVKAEIDALATAALTEHGRLDVWANVAGVIRYSTLMDQGEADYRLIMSVNLDGTYWGCVAAMNAMKETGGAIINVSSAGADMPAPMISVYAATKAAVQMITREVATEGGPFGIRCNAIAPGFTDTPMVAQHFSNPDGSVDPVRREAIFEQRRGQAPLAMTGEPEDQTWSMLFLASDAARFVTGQVLRANAGVVMP
ncbi:MAG: SDR family oxidoreductase [Actinomycetes bacterium]